MLHNKYSFGAFKLGDTLPDMNQGCFEQSHCDNARPARIKRACSEAFDCTVIGGGIHGVTVAKLLSKMGYKTLLLEKGDYASATSSRSSKMAHGGLRYLEMLDFKQVFEGIKCREELFLRAPHLVKPERFLIPIYRGSWWLRCKLHVGLRLYDLMVRNRNRRHRWLSVAKLDEALFGPFHSALMGAFQYTDGLMNDARLVFEQVISAQSYGCCLLNFAEVLRIEDNDAEQPVHVSWKDALTGVEHRSSTRFVVNCAGPWSPKIQTLLKRGREYPVKYSRGSHLVFSVPWRYPSLFLPMEEKGRYYFVWPHRDGTMVGTTEREVETLDDDPIPSADEVREILERLERDLPHLELTEKSLRYAFAGIRILPLRSANKSVSALSRKHIWEMDGRMLSLIGGKYTTFAWTAVEGVKLALKYLSTASQNVPSPIDDLPGFLEENERHALIKRLVNRYPNSEEGIKRAVSRLGRQVMIYDEHPEAWHEIAPGVLMVEALHAVEQEHACTIDGVLRWRLELESTLDWGEGVVRSVRPVIASKHSSADLEAECKQRDKRLRELKTRLLSGKDI